MACVQCGREIIETRHAHTHAHTHAHFVIIARKQLNTTEMFRARAEVIDVQMHEVDLLLECILIRDGQASLPGWFSRSHTNDCGLGLYVRRAKFCD